jgi:hypothetical protein
MRKLLITLILFAITSLTIAGTITNNNINIYRGTNNFNTITLSDGTISNFNESNFTVYNLSNVLVNGTATVNSALGNKFGILLTTNTVIAADMTSYLTNGISRFSLCINPMGYSYNFDTTSLSNSLTLTASNWHTIIFTKGCWWPKFIGTGMKSP